MTDIEKLKEVEKHVGAIASLLGITVTESNSETPYRVAKMYCTELFRNINTPIEDLDAQMKLFNVEGESKVVKIKGIPFHSICEHHWMPFFGYCGIEYVPNNKVLGLSKFPRVVDFYSRKPQLQEKLTNEIGEYLCSILQPISLRVKMTATHTCVMCRGIESPCETETEFEYIAP